MYRIGNLVERLLIGIMRNSILREDFIQTRDLKLFGFPGCSEVAATSVPWRGMRPELYRAFSNSDS
jgi:hypothetical protein